ncbi:MAG: transporter [Cyanobacteria bacterium]|nr:transporter [Cyanobacteriota bacterium]MDA1019933.1 transporter [Cyanobacteriota bacterium]
MLLSCFSAASACSCGTEVLGGYGIGGPILTMPAYTLPKGKIVLGTGLQYNNFKQFSNSTLNALNRRDLHGHSQDSLMVNFVSAAYGMTDDLDLILNYPYRYIYGLKATGHGSTVDQGNSIGFGDLTLLAKYRVYKQQTQVAILGGMRFPTGQTNERDEFGFKLAADDQPGTGSWDPIMGLAISRLYKQMSFDLNASYRLSNQGSQDTIVGDLFSYNIATTYNFKHSMIKDHKLKPSLIVELNGVWQEKTEFETLKDGNHGGNLLYLSPGLRLSLDDLALNFSLGFPLLNDLNGLQPEAGIQLFTSLNCLI